MICLCLCLTCGSPEVVGWRLGYHQLASSADEIVSRFSSPEFGHSSGRSYAPRSPYTRCALIPSSPEEATGCGRNETIPHKLNKQRKVMILLLTMP